MTLEGRTLNNRYYIERLLSKGGMGAVYLGRHALIGKKVAIKVLNPEWSVRDDVVMRFFREAQITSVIGHRNVVDILDIGLIDNQLPFLIMEYMEGETLADLLKREKHIDAAAACGILEPVLQGLAAAHESGVVHRDLKPDNIFLIVEKDGRTVIPKIIDFGISKFTTMIRELKLTQTGYAIGTPPYMSPEQARGDEEIDHRSDIYTTGVMMYEMLVGKMPFWGESVKEIKDKILNKAPIRPTKRRPELPATVEPIIAKAMNKVPDNRYQSAFEMLNDLRGLSEFASRETSLSLLVSRIESKRFVGSDGAAFQSPGSPGTPVSTALSLFSSEPKEVEVETQVPPTSPPRRRTSRLRWFWASVPAALGLFAAVWFYAKPDNLAETNRRVEAGTDATPAVASKDDSRPQQPAFVLIRVNGLPPNAQITANGSPVTNPAFQWPRGDSPVSLLITANGYTPFEAVVIPKGDKIIVAALPPIPLESAQMDTETLGSHKAEKAAAAGVSQKKKKADAEDKSKYIQGSHGAKVSDAFE